MMLRFLWDETGGLGVGLLSLGMCWQRNADFISNPDALLFDGDDLAFDADPLIFT